jgi:ribosomal protein S28E/S33
MKLALGQITEVVGPMATEGVVATVKVEVVDSEEEDREDTRITFNLSLLKKLKTYL